MKKIELLSPSGTLKNMRYAFAFGADAVYAGLPRYSLRVRNNDFLAENLGIGIAEAHRLGKKFFLATNVIPHNAKIRTFIKDMEPIVAMQPDALIMADPGLIMMVRETWPEMPVHLSVQANTVNYATVRFCPWTKSPKSASDARTSNWKFSCTARCASPIPGAACCPAISTAAIRTRAPARTPAAGNTIPCRRAKTPRAIMC